MSLPSAAGTSSSFPAPGAGTFGGHPRGLLPLFLTEMWERFSFYGMRALLTLYMVESVARGGLGYETKKATAIYGTYTMCVYLLSILGGFLADNFIGSRRTVLWGGVIIACGHFCMAFASTETFFAGLALIAVGTGLLKPNISTLVGALYSPTDERRDAGFSIFYMGINIGAFAGSIATGYLAQSASWKARLVSWGFDPLASWHWGFAAAGVGMTLGLIVYLRQQKWLAHVGNPPPPTENGKRPWGKLSLVALGSLGLILVMKASDETPNLIWFIFALQVAAVIYFAFRKDAESKRIAPILVFFIAAEVFWAVFEQTGSTISLFADQLTDNRMMGTPFPSSWWQSVNSVWVILLAPLFAWIWIRMGPRQPSSPMKFTLGLFFVGLSFLLMVPAAKLTVEGKVSPFWLLSLFFLQTVGEMLLSPVGLSTMTKLAPPKLMGLVMGIWFLAAALGSKLAGVLAGNFTSTNPERLSQFFMNQALSVGAATLALLALVPWVKRLMGGVR
ncbi:MAG TPA: peptide MFS transporter [Opitutaceae bacterium]|nr:peptide MFS transporter [Opitutaceae bacterium]